ncbi:uncharacterized protein LOC134853097 isoform X2 [Symsagittifera roscoffensis]|uniref:uncharacterized protein LOC134853097 isoform X2 n=1 Tax=Symsagittifera roscoffensis TaxID=84072 RepID=UPI00307CC7D7
MLKNYSNQHFVTLLSEDSVQPGEFETDWLYIGNEIIIAIEIGLSDTKQQTKNSNCSTISNKITQALKRTIPHFQAILFSLFAASEKQKTEKEIDFIMRVFKVVILLPNITFSQFQKAIDKLKAKQGQTKLFNLLEFNEQFWSTNLFIVLQQDGQSEYVFRIDKNLALCSIKRRPSSDILGCHSNSTNWTNLESNDSRLSKTNSFSDLFTSKSSSQSEIFREISALITLSSLNAIELSQDKLSNRDVDERYRKSFKNWKPKQNNLTYTGQDFILSPEQHRILSNADLSFLLISGEPGSGKTSLLLAKCQMLAEDDDVKIIYFLVNHRKVSFLDFLKGIIDKNGSDLLKKKMIIIAVEEDYHTSLLKNSRQYKRDQIAIVIDEVYSMEEAISVSKCMRHSKIIWAAAVEAGQAVNKGDLARRLSQFKRETLHVLFRNSQHITEVSHHFIESNPSPVFTDNKDVVAGCYQSSQPEISLEYLNLEKENIIDSAPATCFLNQHSGKDYLVVLFTSSKSNKKNGHHVNFDKQNGEEKPFAIIDDTNVEARELPFTGTEVQSVLVLVENFTSLAAINLAITRAQFEVIIIASESLKSDRKWLDYIQRLIGVQLNYWKFMRGELSIDFDWLSPHIRSDADYHWLQKRVERDWNDTTLSHLLNVYDEETLLPIAIAASAWKFFYPGKNNSSVLSSKTCELLTSNERPLFLFFHALRTRETSKVLFSLKTLRSYSVENLESEITDMYGSRTLSSVLRNAMSSYIEDIDLVVMHILVLLFDKQIRAKTIVDQINSWIKSIEGFQDLEDLQTFEIDECARLLILLPTLQQCASSEQYDMIVTSHFGGKWLLQLAIESERNSTVYNLVHLLRTKHYKLLEWEMQHLVSTHRSFSKIAPKDSLYFSSFIQFYKKIGWHPEPLDVNKGLVIFHFILEFYSFYHTTLRSIGSQYEPCSYSLFPLNMKTEDRNAYLNFLKKYGWNNGLLFDACKTGKHENISWSMRFLLNISNPSLLWEIEPLSIGENTLVTELMSSGKTDQDIYRGLLVLMKNGLPFGLLWDHFSLENFTISWIFQSQMTESEKQNFNREIKRCYSRKNLLNEIVLSYDARDAINMFRFKHYNKTTNETLPSDRNLLLKKGEVRFRWFVEFFTWYLFINLTDITPRGTNEGNCIPINFILKLLFLTETNSPMMLRSKDAEDCSEKIELIERKLIEICRTKDFEKFKTIPCQTVTLDSLHEYTSQLGLKHGILNAAYSLENMDVLFSCIRKLLQFPNILNLEFKLFNKSYPVVRLVETRGEIIDKKIRAVIDTLSDCKEESQPISFFFDAEALARCVDYGLRCNSFNFLYLILYPVSHLLPFKQYIGYDPDLSVDDKILSHQQCLSTKFYDRGLLYRACETLQPDNIQWAIDFLGSIDKCLVEAEMTNYYKMDKNRSTHVINMLLSFWYRDQATEENAEQLVTSIKILLKEGFPASLLLTQVQFEEFGNCNAGYISRLIRNKWTHIKAFEELIQITSYKGRLSSSFNLPHVIVK